MRINSVNIFLDFCYLLQNNIFLITDDGIEIMKITAIYATERKGVSTTYILAQKAINELRDDDEVYDLQLLFMYFIFQDS